MLTRVVKLNITPEYHNTFIEFTKREKLLIEQFEGCLGLSIHREPNDHNLFFTISLWQSEDALNCYRASDFFINNWKEVKQWFNARPEAWSLETV